MATLTDLGSPVFAAGSAINLQDTNITFNVGALLAIPQIPGQSGLNFVTPAPVDNLGNTNPTLAVNGWFDRTISHATNVTNNTIDFDFLRGFAQSTGDKRLSLGTTNWQTVSGSQFIVQIQNISVPSRADSENGISYTMNLVATSGT